MRVSEIMTEAAVVDSPDDSLALAAQKMWVQQTGSLLVMDGDELVGIVTERDVLRAVATGVDLSTSVSDMMTKDVATVAPGTSLREGIDHVLAARTGALIVIGDPDEFAFMFSGGIKLELDYSPAFLYELSKMDGAVVLSTDDPGVERIDLSNEYFRAARDYNRTSF